MLEHNALTRWIVLSFVVTVFLAGPDDGPVTSAWAQAAEDGGSLFEEEGASDIADEDPDEIPEGQSVSVGTFGEIELHVKNLEISRVLQLLSIQSKRNIVASRNVAGTLSADLYGVEFYDALDAILQPNGFGYREKGNFIYVYTAAEIEELDEAERTLIHRVIRLNYITAADASAFITPMLSPAGSVSLSGEPPTGFAASAGDGGANSFAHHDTMVVRDYAEVVDEIVGILSELDVRPTQVLIEATILQAALDDDTALGVDFNIVADYTMANFETPLNVVDTIMDPANIIGDADTVLGAIGTGEAIQSTVGNVLGGDSSMKLGILGSEFSVFVRALDRVTDTTVVANPKVMVLNRQRADLLVGGRLGYLSTTSTESSTTQTVEFLDVGTQLSVRPFISEDGFVRMELRPSISDGTTSAVDGVVIPNETTQEMTTNIMVRSGQTIVLGGLFKEDISTTRTQWPILGDLPLAGGAFKGKDDQVDRSEVIFLIKPTVIKDEALYAAGEHARESIEQARLGARQGLLPWSRSKLVAGHMRDAHRYYRDGDTEKALWCTNLALWLEPDLVEARRLKVELTGQQIDEWQGGEILQDAVNRMVEHHMIHSVDTGSTNNIDASNSVPAQKASSDIQTAPASDMFDGPATDVPNNNASSNAGDTNPFYGDDTAGDINPFADDADGGTDRLDSSSDHEPPAAERTRRPRESFFSREAEPTAAEASDSPPAVDSEIQISADQATQIPDEAADVDATVDASADEFEIGKKPKKPPRFKTIKSQSSSPTSNKPQMRSIRPLTR